MEKTAKANILMVVKLACMAVYFMVMSRFMFRIIFFVAENGLQTANVIQGFIRIVIFLYSLTWLYKWLVKDEMRGWHKQSAAFVVCGTAYRILLDAMFLMIYRGDVQRYSVNMLQIDFLNLLYGVGIFILLFFVFDHRKVVIAKQKVFWWISVIAVAVICICLMWIVYFVQIYAGIDISKPVSLVNDYEMLKYIIGPDIRTFILGISSNIYRLETITFISLFLLLWINTKPRETANAVYKNSTIVRL